MRGLPRSARFYILAVGLTGGLLLFRAGRDLLSHGVPRADLLIFVALAIAAEVWQLELSYKANYSVGLAVCLAAAVILGVPEAILVSVAGTIAADAWKRKPLYKMVFNTTALTVAVAAGGWAYEAARVSPPGDLSPADLPALGLYAASHLTANTLLLCLVIAFATGTRPWDVARANFSGLFVPIVALYPLGVLMSVTYVHFGGWLGLALLAVPTVAVYSALNTAQALRAHTRAALEALADALDRRDQYTSQHSQRVAGYVDAIARTLKLSLAERELVVAAARVHDLGKVSTPDAILRKPAPLDDGEWEVMREHPRAGAEILSRLPMYKEHARLVGAHHERLDGDGYPHRLDGATVPLGAQILAVADAYDAMTSDRPYRRALPAAVAISRLREARGTQFNPAVVEALARSLEEAVDWGGKTPQTKGVFTGDSARPRAHTGGNDPDGPDGARDDDRSDSPGRAAAAVRPGGVPVLSRSA